jgi:hypothetical protein
MNGNEALDPVVERTRQAREALARQCGYDVDKMAELFRALQAEHPERVGQPAPTPHPQRPGVEAV